MTKSFSGQTQDQIKSFCRRQQQDQLFYYLFILFIIFYYFFSRANTSSGRAHDKKNLNSNTRLKIHENKYIS